MSDRPGHGRTGLVNLLLALGAVIFGLALVELLAWGYVRATTSGSRGPARDVRPLVEYDPDYGYVLPADRTIHAIKYRANGTPCYDVTYRTDAFRRRTTGRPHDPSRPHLLLFGCSVTMGEGLPDADTLDARLAPLVPGYDVYNYGVHGYGPEHMLARLQARTLSAEVANDRGVALFVLLPMHVSRAIGDTRAFWTYTSPYYRIDGDGQLRRHGSFASGRRVVTWLYEAFNWLKRRSNFLSLFDINLPLRLGDRQARLTARILGEARREYRAQFEGEFYVLFHPTWSLDNAETHELYESLRAHLAAAGVPMLDYARVHGLLASEKIDPTCDLHPNGRLNGELAAQLARDLPAP